MIDPLLEAYRHDRDPHLLESIAEPFRPLVVSVCRRYLRNPEDVSDAVQETFLRFMRSADTIHGSVAGWFAATAQAVSVDLVRRTIRAREHSQRLRPVGNDPASQEQIARRLIQHRLNDALGAMDESRRALLTARYFRRLPLRVIAGDAEISVATASRRVRDALGELAGILRDMGLHPLDATSLAEELGDNSCAAFEPVLPGADALRFAPDWSILAATKSPGGEAAFLPGWTRPIRVGVLVGHMSLLVPDIFGKFLDVEAQALSAQHLHHPGIQLVGIVEHGTTSRGPIERTLRDYELVAGLIDASDPVGLSTLDVIILGINFKLAPGVASAVNRAVRGGVGLLNEWRTGTLISMVSSPEVMDLMLATPPVYAFHTKPHCGIYIGATITRSHSLVGDVPAGALIKVNGCGHAYREMPGAQVVAIKEHIVQESEHGLAGIGPMVMPVWLCGTLGKGRVVVANMGYRHDTLPRQLGLDPERYFLGLLEWLGEPKRPAL